MKRMAAGLLALCLGGAFALAGCAWAGNPMAEYGSVAQAAGAMDIEAWAPARLPEGYAENSVHVVGGETLQVIYRDRAENRITYRTRAAAEGDVSGIYTRYKAEEELMVAGHPVQAKGDGGGWSLAVWETGGMDYSLYFDAPATDEELEMIIGGMEPVTG